MLSPYIKKGARVFPSEFRIPDFPINLKKNSSGGYSLTNYQAIYEALKIEYIPKRGFRKSITKLLKRAQEQGFTKNHTKVEIEEKIKDLARYNKTLAIKDSFPDDKKCVWLPSESDEPRIEHLENYGKVYQCNKGIKEFKDYVIPSEDYGCKCGFRVLN